ncbi:hypothetical protein ACFOEE_01680 [Pseudoalteromonas fenneropenaei]|uniref:Uncharacterized protein n=1 Tax=Pseudoalteromonas fenneropenaei TaxID=1737459 RepID=A0ABV7CF66_9GAMM
MEFLMVLALIYIVGRLRENQINIVSSQDFVTALTNNPDAVVVHVNRKIFWIFTQKRNYYMQHYKGFQLTCVSYHPLELPHHIDVITVNKW